MSEPDSYWHITFRNAVLLSIVLVLISIAIGWRAGYTSGINSGTQLATASFQKDAIKQGAAQYDSVSGDWRWKTVDESTPLPAKDVPTVITNAPLYEPSLLPELPPEPTPKKKK